MVPAFPRCQRQIETAAALGVGTVGDDAEVAHPVAVAQQLALARADADGEIAARRDRVLFPGLSQCKTARRRVTLQPSSISHDPEVPR